MELSIRPSLTKEAILHRVTELQIYEKYVGHAIKEGNMYMSPFRDEGRPSFNIYTHQSNGRLWYKDFGHSSGDCFQVVQLLSTCDFPTALKLINNDFGLNLDTSIGSLTELTSSVEFTRKQKIKAMLGATIKPYTSKGREYWFEYHIKDNYLKFFKVFAVEQAWYNDYAMSQWKDYKDNPLFGYWFGGHTWKFYRPLATDLSLKWHTNATVGYLQGWNQLPETASICIITKSLKDVIVFRRLGIAAVAPNGEGYGIPERYVTELQVRFKSILIFYDNDKAGVEYAKVLSNVTGLDYAHLPIDDTEKDMAEFVKHNGLEFGLDVLHDLYII